MSAIRGVDRISPEELRCLDRLDAATAQLGAMLHMTYGNHLRAFQTLSDKLKDDYMWACAEKADEISQALKELEVHRAHREGRPPGAAT